ncbi:hypothetical protein [Kibdelosporangium aridum]|uniref:hypothetical protein n=1 Tax=Kibdelosporangium aridum TaxID=2030 RepID=UPI00117A6C6B|nr:hypothetical protein [Kibdelosporangium aridum]
MYPLVTVLCLVGGFGLAGSVGFGFWLGLRLLWVALGSSLVFFFFVFQQGFFALAFIPAFGACCGSI